MFHSVSWDLLNSFQYRFCPNYQNTVIYRFVIAGHIVMGKFMFHLICLIFCYHVKCLFTWNIVKFLLSNLMMLLWKKCLWTFLPDKIWIIKKWSLILLNSFQYNLENRLFFVLFCLFLNAFYVNLIFLWWNVSILINSSYKSLVSVGVILLQCLLSYYSTNSFKFAINYFRKNASHRVGSMGYMEIIMLWLCFKRVCIITLGHGCGNVSFLFNALKPGGVILHCEP